MKAQTIEGLTNKSKISNVIKQAQGLIFKETGINVVLIPSYPKGVNESRALELTHIMCSIWNVRYEWLIEPNRRHNRPIMRRIIWLAIKRNFPDVTHETASRITGVTNHTTSVKGVREAIKWLAIKDALFMRYYTPVAHLVSEDLLTELINAE